MAKSFRNSKWYSLILLSILAVIFVWQLSNSVRNLFVIITGEKIQGVVQKPTCSNYNCRSKTVSLKIEYFTPDGQAGTFEQFGMFVPYYPVGEQVTVYYSPKSGNVAVFSLFNIINPLIAIIMLMFVGWFFKGMLREKE